MPADGDSSQPKLKISQWSLSIWRVAASTLGIPGDALRTDEELRAWVSRPGFESQPLVNELLELEEEFGIDVGHDFLDEALRERAVDPGAWGQLSAPDLVARAFVEMHAEGARGEQRVRDAFVSARFRTAAVHGRTTFEFAGEAGRALPRDLRALKESLRLTFFGEGYGMDVEAEYLDDALFIGRGGKLRAPVVVENGQRKALLHRPAVTDVLRYNLVTGKLRITARSRRLARIYADALGEVFFGTKAHFADGVGLTLEPLKRGPSALAPRPGSPVDRVTLLKFTGCEGTFLGGGEAADLERFVASYPEIDLTEARLKIELKDGTRLIAYVRPQKGVVVDKKAHEALVEEYLTHVGVRGTKDEALTLWSAFPWEMRQADWRDVFGNELDGLVAAGVLEGIRLRSVQSAVGGDELVVHAVSEAAGDYYGVGREPEDGARALTASDIEGLRMLPRALAEHIAGRLRCEKNIVELDDGRVWRLGRCEIGGKEIELVLVVAAPSRPLREITEVVLAETKFIALVPSGETVAGLCTVSVKSWLDASSTRTRLAEALGVAEALPLNEQRPDGVAVDRASGCVAVFGSTIELGVDSPQLKLIDALATAYPAAMSTHELDKIVGAWARPLAAMKSAKSDLKKAFVAAGVDINKVMSKKGQGNLRLIVPVPAKVP